MIIEEYIQKASSIGASDVHIVCGLPPKCRKDGELIDLYPEILTGQTCEQIASELAGERYDDIRKIGELDMAKTIADERVRINIFRQQGNVSVALRILASKIPQLESLNLPSIVNDFAAYGKGIVLVTGETGSGKSTTLAAILDRINAIENVSSRLVVYFLMMAVVTEESSPPLK